MRIINKHILGKLIRKNRGNSKLVKSVQQLISDIEDSNWNTPHDLAEKRPDADCVYGGEFYFFNINIHRTLIMIESGSHDDYELIFKNNRNVIKKWLRDNNWI